jgi:hypothetical protein
MSILSLPLLPLLLPLLLLPPPASVAAVVPLQKGEHYHIDDGQDAINNIYACGLIEEINIEPEQDMQDPSKINIRLVVEEVQPKSMEVRVCGVCVGVCVGKWGGGVGRGS